MTRSEEELKALMEMASKANEDHTTLALRLMSVATFTMKEGYDYTWATDQNPKNLYTPKPSTIILSWVTSCCQPLFHSFLLHALAKKIHHTHQPAIINNWGELVICQESHQPLHEWRICHDIIILCSFLFGATQQPAKTKEEREQGQVMVDLGLSSVILDDICIPKLTLSSAHIIDLFLNAFSFIAWQMGTTQQSTNSVHHNN